MPILDDKKLDRLLEDAAEAVIDDICEEYMALRARIGQPIGGCAEIARGLRRMYLMGKNRSG